MSASEEQTVEINTELFRAKFSNRGAVLKSWELKRYTTPSEQGAQPVQLVYSGGRFKGPLSLTTNDQALTNDLERALYMSPRTCHSSTAHTLSAMSPSGIMMLNEMLTL